MPTDGTVHKKLDQLITDVSEIKSSVGLIAHRTDENTAEISRIDKIVCGNGDPGLKGDVQSLKEHKTRVSQLTWAIVGPAIAIVIASLWAVLH